MPQSETGDGEGGAAPRGELYIPALVELQASNAPNALAVSDGKNGLTFLDLEKRSGELAGCLRAMGVARDVVVGVFADRSIALVVGALGVMRAGGAYLPLDPSYPADRLFFQFADSGADILIAGEGLSEDAFAATAKHVVILSSDGRLKEQRAHEPVSARVAAGDLAYVIYTSGSTGRPKGAQNTHGGLLNLVSWFQKSFAVTPKDRISQVAAVGFDATVWELWPALAAGASIHIADTATAKDPKKLQDWLVRAGITVSFVPTPMAERLIAFEWPAAVSLRTMTTAGDTLHRYPPPNLPFQVVNNYGPTECTVCATSGVLPTSDVANGLPPLGRPIANTQIYIVDETGVRVPDGTEGEIWIGGHGVGRGYLNRPDLTAEKFVPNVFDPQLSLRLYRTGDRGYFLPDGQIAFKGRIDDQIKIRGVRMEPGEIEAALDDHRSVRESVVVAREFGDDKRLVAYIVLKGRRAPAVRELREFLAKRLPAQMIPSIFVVMSNLPLNASGKIDRRSLPAPTDLNILSTDDRAAPRDELEKQLQRVWEELLQIKNIGIQQDFFDLGGDSLLAARLVVSVEAILHVQLPSSALLEVRTIEDMARVIRSQNSATPWSSLVAVQPLGARPPLFCVHSHTGDVLYCEYISRGAGPDQPIYGLQSQAVAGRPPHRFVSEMASDYVSELRSVQQHGPYHLFGFCFGGMVAFEMARQLEEQGHEVAFLGVYNSPAPGTLKGWPLGQFTYLKRRTKHEWQKLLALKPNEKLSHVLRNLRNFRLMIQRSIASEDWGILSRIRATGRGRGTRNLETINIAAAKSFFPDYVFPGQITLFLSPDVAEVYPVSPVEGWKAFASKGVEFIEVPLDNKGWRGTPFVEAVGGRIRDSLCTGNLGPDSARLSRVLPTLEEKLQS